MRESRPPTSNSQGSVSRAHPTNSTVACRTRFRAFEFICGIEIDKQVRTVSWRRTFERSQSIVSRCFVVPSNASVSPTIERSHPAVSASDLVASNTTSQLQ